MTSAENSAVGVVCGTHAASELIGVSASSISKYSRSALLGKIGGVNVYDRAALLELWVERGKRPVRHGTIYLDQSFKYYRRGAGFCRRNEWRAEIVVHGKRFRCRAGSYARCVAWCSDMVRKYGAF